VTDRRSWGHRLCEHPAINVNFAIAAVPVISAICHSHPHRTKDTKLLVNLSANETRIIGCLLEKAVTTPEQYPLTLNSLTNACNQKSARDPVMSLQPGVVQKTIRDLKDKHLVRVEENFKTRAEKYTQRFCNTRFSEYQFDPAQYAIVCLLLLRGPQTPGELRARSGRLHSFADNGAVVQSLDGLAKRETPLIVKLARTPGRKDSEYMHLFGGPVKVATTVQAPASATPGETRRNASRDDLEERVSRLETELAELRRRLDPAD
jgi:uncharacterized protein YceH (UPF0502 family)